LQVGNNLYGYNKDVLFLVTRLVAYWPAPIHAVAHANLRCRYGRQSCKSIFRSLWVIMLYFQRICPY